MKGNTHTENVAACVRFFTNSNLLFPVFLTMAIITFFKYMNNSIVSLKNKG